MKKAHIFSVTLIDICMIRKQVANSTTSENQWVINLLSDS